MKQKIKELIKYLTIYLYSIAQVIPSILWFIIAIAILYNYNIFFPLRSLQIAGIIIFLGNYFYNIKKATNLYKI